MQLQGGLGRWWISYIKHCYILFKLRNNVLTRSHYLILSLRATQHVFLFYCIGIELAHQEALRLKFASDCKYVRDIVFGHALL